MEVTRTLVKNICDVRYEALAANAVDMTKKLVLDALACALAGSSMVGMRELVELVGEWGGREESAIVGFGKRAASPSAALVNATMGRILDFDDTHDIGVLHPGVPVVFASFATAEHRGGVGGKKFILAVALGIDLSCRLGIATALSVLDGYGWDYTDIYSPFSAAAASGKILELGEDKLLNAMGIAYHQASGTICEIEYGYTTKGLGSGFAARAGVVSALMAEKGLTGGKESLEGKHGLYRVFQRGSYIPEYLTAELGKSFRVEDDSFKPYPCCRCIHGYIDATLLLVKESNIKPQDVEKVTCYVGQGTHSTICEPLDLKQNPPNSVSAQFSIPWALANAITYGKISIKHFAEEALEDKDVGELARKIVTELDPALSRREIEPAVVEIQSREGKVYSKRVEHALGSPANPVSMEDVANKFRDCASYAVRPISKEKVEQMIQMVERLEDIGDVGQVISLIS